MTTDTDKSSTLQKVRTYSFDIESFESHIKTLKDELKEIVEDTDEYSKIVELKNDLAALTDQLKRTLLNKPRYVEILESLGDERESLKGAKHILSEYLIAYHAETRERQIEIGNKDAREVVLTGKLGKRQKLFQANIFTKRGTDV